MGRILSNITPLSFCMQKFGYTLKKYRAGGSETLSALLDPAAKRGVFR